MMRVLLSFASCSLTTTCHLAYLLVPPIKYASISLVARNLWLLYSNVDNLDPVSLYNSTNRGIGLEHSGVPQTRSIGLNLNVRL